MCFSVPFFFPASPPLIQSCNPFGGLVDVITKKDVMELGRKLKQGNFAEQGQDSESDLPRADRLRVPW